MTLGEKLYTLRTKQNMTQEQLAEKLQVSRQSISKWESDATRPDLGKLKFLAEFYHEVRRISDIGICSHKYSSTGDCLQHLNRN